MLLRCCSPLFAVPWLLFSCHAFCSCRLRAVPCNFWRCANEVKRAGYSWTSLPPRRETGNRTRITNAPAFLLPSSQISCKPSAPHSLANLSVEIPSSRWRYPAKLLPRIHKFSDADQPTPSHAQVHLLPLTTRPISITPRQPGVHHPHHGLRRLCLDMRKDSSSTMSSGRTKFTNYGRTQRADELLRTIYRTGKHNHISRRDWFRAYSRPNNAGRHDNTRAE